VIGTPDGTLIPFLLQVWRQAGLCCAKKKPIELDMEKSLAAANEVERLGADVIIAFNRRFDPTIPGFRKRCDAGDVGECAGVVISSRDSGDCRPGDTVEHSGGNL